MENILTGSEKDLKSGAMNKTVHSNPQKLKYSQTSVTVNGYESNGISNAFDVKPKISNLNLDSRMKTFNNQGSGTNNYNIKINIFSNHKFKFESSKLSTSPKEKASNKRFSSMIGSSRKSKRWKMLSNLIKTLSVLQKYEAVAINVRDLDSNLKDYKQRLLPHSPLKIARDNKRKNTQHPCGSVLEKNKEALPRRKANSHQKLVKINSNNQIEPADASKEELSSKNQISVDYNISSIISQSVEEDVVEIEMNKINNIERIKNYILE